MFTFQFCDALTKVLPGEKPRAGTKSLSGLVGETLSFQTAWIDSMPNVERSEITIAVTPIFEHDTADQVTAESVTIRAFQVGLVPANMPAPENPDDGYFVTDPTLLPDILNPLDVENAGEGEADPTEADQVSDGDPAVNANARGHSRSVIVTTESKHRGWNSVWWDVVATPRLTALDVKVTYRQRHGHDLSDEVQPLWQDRIDVHVASAKLPAPKLHNVQWFHADSLANYYDVEPWSELHWKITEAHMRSCARMRVNTILTPVWTPALDVAPGVYRRNVQLLDITDRDGRYEFDFSNLDRWIDLLLSSGLTGVEVPHLFTQWGAKSTPRFWIQNNEGELEPRFGWDTPATAPEYREFLEQLIPALRNYFNAKIGERNVWYHVSDEPERRHLESYAAARNVVLDLLDGAQLIDALDDPDFQDYVQTPVVASNSVPRFRARGINPSWVYYCVAQYEGVANRFLAQNPARHRMLGFQLYKGRAEGFLHWAFNFYNTQFSLGSLDPYRDTAAGGGFISGDPFVVYPAPDGSVLESLRHRMLRAAFDDLAACQLAESRVGRDAVLAVIDPAGDLDYNAGWVDEPGILRRRQKLNELIVGE